MVSDKTFKIVVIAILVLILGAILGNFTSFEFDDEPIFLDDDDFDDLGVVYTESDHYSFDRYTFSEYKSSISTVDDLLDYVTSQGFEIIEDDQEFIVLEREGECEYNLRLQEEICYEEIMEIYVDEGVLEILVVGEFEDE